MVDTCLRDELLAMRHDDQRLRWHALGQNDPHAQAAAWSTVAEADRRHTSRIREIINTRGWPGRDLVGEDGARAAWLIVQHADHDPQFQAHCLPLLAAAVHTGQASPVDLVYLAHRVATGPLYAPGAATEALADA